MASVFQESNEVLTELWREHNPTEEEYLQKEKVIDWIKEALEKTNSLQNFQNSLTDLEGLIKQYLSEVHEVNEEGLQNISLNYSESVDFLRWLTRTEAAEPQQHKEEEPEQEQGKEDIPQSPEKSHEDEPNISNEAEQELKLSKNQLSASRSNSSPKIKNINHVNEVHDSPIPNTSSHHIQAPKNLVTQASRSDEVFENATVSANEFNLEVLSKKYKDYLRIIFEHYCKISYATGQDPTFQQIHHKTTIMTINKFMMFCKDFDIGKISPAVNRPFLVEIFKKNSECYKEMSFDQFDTVLKKLSEIGFSDGVDPNQSKDREEQELLSVQMVKMLQFCDLSSPRKFKQKLKRLNIQYRSGPKTNAELKVVPDGYRFKFTSNNGKSEEQVKQEVEERRQHRSERKILLQQKNTNHQVEPKAFRKRTQTKRTERMVYTKDRELASIRETVVKEGASQSSNALLRVLHPPLPPQRKVSNLPPQPPKLTQTPISVSNQGTSSQNQNIFKKELSYAEMHKLKQSQGYGKKKFGLNKSVSKDQKHTFKLNSIVQQARQQVKEHKEINSDLTDSIATNSREQTNRSRLYDVNKINSKMQIINQRIRRDRQIQQDLNGILDMSNDEDEFLQQHLEREKKNQLINKRLSQRIQGLDRQF